MRRLRDKLFYLFEVLLIVLGILMGVFFSQYKFFQIDNKISISDLFIFVLSSIIGLYIANNISRSLAKSQTVKSLFQDDIKTFITYSKKLEEWIEAGAIPAAELRTHLKTGNLKLRSLQKIYSSSNQASAPGITLVINKYNRLKTNITNINTINRGLTIPLIPAEVGQYMQELEDIKGELLNIIIQF